MFDFASISVTEFKDTFGEMVIVNFILKEKSREKELLWGDTEGM